MWSERYTSLHYTQSNYFRKKRDEGAAVGMNPGMCERTKIMVESSYRLHLNDNETDVLVITSPSSYNKQRIRVNSLNVMTKFFKQRIC